MPPLPLWKETSLFVDGSPVCLDCDTKRSGDLTSSRDAVAVSISENRRHKNELKRLAATAAVAASDAQQRLHVTEPEPPIPFASANSRGGRAREVERIHQSPRSNNEKVPIPVQRA